MMVQAVETPPTVNFPKFLQLSLYTSEPHSPHSSTYSKRMYKLRRGTFITNVIK